MNGRSLKGWRSSEVYELACFLIIAECIWLVGVNLGLFDAIQKFSAAHGLADLIMLGFLMSFAMLAGALRKSYVLRREIRSRARAESRAHGLARQDTLTGLPNRRLLLDFLESTVAERAADEPFAVLVIDLDRFKPVNDIHGHAAGDAVLCEVAAASPRFCREEDLQRGSAGTSWPSCCRSGPAPRNRPASPRR
jgi:predicted signal transduction protein with EAL and GGDEF domain